LLIIFNKLPGSQTIAQLFLHMNPTVKYAACLKEHYEYSFPYTKRAAECHWTDP